MLSSTDAKVVKVNRALGAGDAAAGNGVSNCGGSVTTGVEVGSSVEVGSKVGVGLITPVTVGVGVDDGSRVGVGVGDGGMGVGVLITATGVETGGAD